MEQHWFSSAQQLGLSAASFPKRKPPHTIHTTTVDATIAPKSSCHSHPVWVAVLSISCSISTMEGLPVLNQGKVLWEHIYSGHKLKILDNSLSPVIWKIGALGTSCLGVLLLVGYMEIPSCLLLRGLQEGPIEQNASGLVLFPLTWWKLFIWHSPDQYLIQILQHWLLAGPSPSFQTSTQQLQTSYSFSQSHRMIKVEQTSEITKPNPSPPPPCPLPTSFSATPPWLFNASRYSDPTTPWAAVPLHHHSFREFFPNTQPEHLAVLGTKHAPPCMCLHMPPLVRAAEEQTQPRTYCKLPQKFHFFY
eukprot:XP_004936495.1 uncharacterized protein LOC101748431 [Gallus gallus]